MSLFSVYSAVRTQMSAFLSDCLSSKVLNTHIICPSRHGDISTTVIMALGLVPEKAFVTVNEALHKTPPQLFGAPIIASSVLEGGYINFSVSPTFVVNAARYATDTLPLPTDIEDVMDETDYALVRAEMLSAWGDLPIKTDSADLFACISALWSCFGLIEKNTNNINDIVLSALDVLCTITPSTKSTDLFEWREYSEWLIKLIWQAKCK